MARRILAVLLCPALIGILVMSLAPQPLRADLNNYVQTNLVSDIPGLAANTDPNLVNPWGIAFGPTSPFWISDNHTGLSTVYRGSGEIVPLVVTIPPPGGSPAGTQASPTGAVFNGSADFNGDLFLFATEDGTIAGWNGGTSAIREVDNSGASAVYKGIAIAGDLLYATNFSAGTIDVFNSSFGLTTVPGGFVDPTLPAGFAPFNIENIGGQLFVTYAKQDSAKHDDVAGDGNGFIDVFDTSGVLLRRFASQGPLNSPWGMAVAPSNFGAFSNTLLVGNFGNGRINAFNLSTGAFVGQMLEPGGRTLTIQGLWGLTFGNGGSAGSRDRLYFTAGIPGGGEVEDHGQFGEIR